MKKKISVVIPTYDRFETTLKAIESVISSKPDLVEIIVVDDCGSIPFHYPAQKNGSQIDVKVVLLEVNSGPGVARKFGVSQAAANYIAFLDSDDVFTPCWIDYLLNVLHLSSKNKLYIAGMVVGGKGVGSLVTKLLIKMPVSSQTVAVRCLSVFFNPFYTPSLFMHKDCCHFLDDLRYCEDYYTNAFGLFTSNKVLVVSKVACELGREPNSEGGESNNKAQMHNGEMIVRRKMLKSHLVPIPYRLFIPMGMLYQVLRVWIKSFK